MNATSTVTPAETLKDLHELFRRGRAIRDRLESGPKTVAAKQLALAKRQADLEVSKKALQDVRSAMKKNEGMVLSLRGKIDDLKVKLNAIKKQVEYDAIRNQIAHDEASIRRIEDEILTSMMSVDEQAAAVAQQEAETKAFAADTAALQNDVESKAGSQKATLVEIEKAIAESESIIPAEDRDRYRRAIKQRGDDAFAIADPQSLACYGCFVNVTLQCMNNLLNGNEMVFCKNCGRILYLSGD